MKFESIQGQPCCLAPSPTARSVAKCQGQGQIERMNLISFVFTQVTRNLLYFSTLLATNGERKVQQMNLGTFHWPPLTGTE